MYTYAIIALTVIVSFACFNNRSFFDALALKPYRIVHNRQWYRIITHGFVHGDFMHLFINMFVFWSFGSYIENYLFASLEYDGYINRNGSNFLLLYFGGMVAASIYDVVKRRDDARYTSIGASGAVSAVVFCSIFLNPWGRILFFGVIPMPGFVFGVLYLIYTQYSAMRSSDRVNHFAHLFGAVYGLLFPMLMNPALARVFIDNFR